MKLEACIFKLPPSEVPRVSFVAHRKGCLVTLERTCLDLEGVGALRSGLCAGRRIKRRN